MKIVENINFAVYSETRLILMNKSTDFELTINLIYLAFPAFAFFGKTLLLIICMHMPLALRLNLLYSRSDNSQCCKE